MRAVRDAGRAEQVDVARTARRRVGSRGLRLHTARDAYVAHGRSAYRQERAPSPVMATLMLWRGRRRTRRAAPS
eukprot:4088922-Prymnesium_polylepis.1